MINENKKYKYNTHKSSELCMQRKQGCVRGGAIKNKDKTNKNFDGNAQVKLINTNNKFKEQFLDNKKIPTHTEAIDQIVDKF